MIYMDTVMNDPGNGDNNIKTHGKLSSLDRLVAYIKKEYGLVIDNRRRQMLATRLQNRILDMGFRDLETYADYLMCQGGLKRDLVELVNATTTRTTSFFRENGHFEFIQNTVLPELKQKNNHQKFSFRAWSAACSTGQEAYTLAMVLDHQKMAQSLNMDYRITASDISEKALSGIRMAIYSRQDIKPIPEILRKKYLLVSKKSLQPKYRIVNNLRDKIDIKVNNLGHETYTNIPKNQDIIMLRNVLIYFDHETQINVVSKILNHLKSDGYLMLGHSESLPDYRELGLVSVAPATYQIKKN